MLNLSLFRAEWRKIGGNRPVILFMIWIFPIGAVVVTIFALLVNLSMPHEFRTRPNWVEQLLLPWYFPGSELGRLLMLSFTSVVLAGEYQWGTWKGILVRHDRAAIILVKFLTVNAYMLVAFALTSILMGIGGALVAASAGAPYGPPITGDLLGGFARQYLLQVALAVVTTTIGAGYAAVAAIYSRSILGGVMTGLGLATVEVLLPLILNVLARLLRLPEIVALYRLSPTYNIGNAGSWLLQGQGAETPMLTMTLEPLSLGVSLLILAGWVVGLVGLTVWLFRRQDITT
ncbi:MAG: ABC transporter permease [Anaerolineae bacterium]|nr:ABC transporter permease [Anaerolineae bacterium]